MGLGSDPPRGLIMRVLHLTPELPYERGGGGRGREYFLCRRLVELGHDVLNISPALPHELAHADALRDVGAENWVVARPRSHAREALGAALREPEVLATAAAAPVRALEMRIFWQRLRAPAQRAVREWHPDIAVIGHDMAAAWAAQLPGSLPAVITLHNLTWNWYRSRARRAHGPAAMVLRAEAWRYRRHVLRLLPRFSAAIAVSTVEAAELRDLASLQVEVVPTGMDVQHLHPAPDPAGSPRVLFAASLGYPPNSEGIRWFAHRVWPLVREQLPRAELEVAGRNPPEGVRALERLAGVSVTGEVPDMAPHFAAAHAAVVPILTGAGMRVKIVEAMANGRAVVSTSLGWEGLPHVEPGRHLLVADGPAAFAQATIRLLREPDVRHRLATEGRMLAERHYDWRALGDRQEALLRQVLRQ